MFYTYTKYSNVSKKGKIIVHRTTGQIFRFLSFLLRNFVKPISIYQLGRAPFVLGEDLNERASVSWPNQSFLLFSLVIFYFYFSFAFFFPFGKRWYYPVTFVTSASRWSSLSRFSGFKLETGGISFRRILQFNVQRSFFDECSFEEISFEDCLFEDTECLFVRTNYADSSVCACVCACARVCNGTNFWNLKSIS